MTSGREGTALCSAHVQFHVVSSLLSCMRVAPAFILWTPGSGQRTGEEVCALLGSVEFGSQKEKEL